MDRATLLLIDGDVRSLRVLEVALRKAGFNVVALTSSSEAIASIDSANPDLIISDTRLTGMDGFELCRHLKEEERWRAVPFIFLTSETSIEDKIRGLELGVEEYLTKPIYIKEILTRVRMLLQKRERAEIASKRENQTTFRGILTDLGVIDLFQTIEVSRKSGVIQLRSGSGREGAVYFRDGQVVDSECGRLRGEEAVYRLLTWNDGTFEVHFQLVRRAQKIEISTQALLMEGMRRLDEWSRLTEQLPPLETVCGVDVDHLHEHLATIPDSFNPVLRLLNEQATLAEVLDESPYDDLETLEVLSQMYFEGVIGEVDGPKNEKQISGLLAANWLKESTAVGSFNETPSASNGASSAEDLAMSLALGAHTRPSSDLEDSPPAELLAHSSAPHEAANEKQAFEGDEAPTRDFGPTKKRQAPKTNLRTKSITSGGESTASVFGEVEDTAILAKPQVVTINPSQPIDAADIISAVSETPSGPVENHAASDDAATATAPAFVDEAEATAAVDGPVAFAGLGEPTREVEPPAAAIAATNPNAHVKDTTAAEHADEPSESRRRIIRTTLEDASAILNGYKSEDPQSVFEQLTDEPTVVPVEAVDIDVEATPLPVSAAGKGDRPRSRSTSIGLRVAPSKSRSRLWAVLIPIALAVPIAILIATSGGKGEATKPSNTIASSSAVATSVESSAALESQNSSDTSVASASAATSLNSLTSSSTAPIVASASSETSAASESSDDAADDDDEDPARTARRAKRYYQQGRLTEALAMIDKALEQIRSRRNRLLRADILADMGRRGDALKEVNSLVARYPSYASAWSRKGTLLWKMGQKTQAKSAYKRYLALEPDSSRAEQIRALIGIKK